MADSGSSNAPPGIARITAPILFGPMINWALYGVLCVQLYVYGYNFPDDRRALKFLVYFVFLLETAQTALTGADVYYWFMAGFGDLEGLKKSKFSPIDIPTMDAFISLIVQVFFCFRIWLLSQRIWWLCLVIAILAVAQAVGALWGGFKSAALGKYALIQPSLCLWLITSAVMDILIAVAMTCLLRQGRGNENRITSYVLPRIVRLTIETNTLTATVAIISFALYIGFPVSKMSMVTNPVSEQPLYLTRMKSTMRARRALLEHCIPTPSSRPSTTVSTSATTHHAHPPRTHVTTCILTYLVIPSINYPRLGP
ncbi:hypothetical protein BJV74DRAFT_841722 [Russula compacta]|nr:hypothetical protein BJV74DRAFT_841722 [Russula compacta]